MSGLSPEIPALIERLVGIDTTSHRSNLEAISFIRERLEALGAECRLTYDDQGGKANLFATLGPAGTPGIVLSGHTDVVPAHGQPWSHDPFRLVERDGRFYGRGAADMKSFIALALAIAPEYLARDPHTPLHFAFSYDEELGCIGVRRLIADLETLPVRPRLCIVGEPTGMRVVAGHKCKMSLSAHVHGKECHSALAEGVNAIEAASRVIAHIGDIQDRLRRLGPFDAAYEPPYSTLSTGLVEGGRALNIVPGSCSFEFEIRALPTQDPHGLKEEIFAFARDRLEPSMKSVDPDAGFSFEVVNDTAGFDLPDGHEAVRLLLELSGDNRTGRVSFGTEAGLFNRAGIPTLVCGPGHIEQAHKADEYVSRDQLELGERFLKRLLDRLCRKP